MALSAFHIQGVPEKDSHEYKRMPHPFYAPPYSAKTKDGISLGLATKNTDGTLEIIKPSVKVFTYKESKYLVAIHLDGFGSNVPHMHCWLYIYNKAMNEWRRFQTTHFRNVWGIDAILREDTGDIAIIDSANKEILTTINLRVTSDDAAHVRLPSPTIKE